MRAACLWFAHTVSLEGGSILASFASGVEARGNFARQPRMPASRTPREQMSLGNESAADAIRALLGLLRPNRLQTDPHWRENGHVQDRQNAFRKSLLFVEFNGNSAKAQVNDARTTRVLLAEHRVRVST